MSISGDAALQIVKSIANFATSPVSLHKAPFVSSGAAFGKDWRKGSSMSAMVCIAFFGDPSFRMVPTFPNLSVTACGDYAAVHFLYEFFSVTFTLRPNPDSG